MAYGYYEQAFHGLFYAVWFYWFTEGHSMSSFYQPRELWRLTSAWLFFGAWNGMDFGQWFSCRASLMDVKQGLVRKHRTDRSHCFEGEMHDSNFALVSYSSCVCSG